MTIIAAFGMGRVGGEATYTSAITGFADELVLYDLNKELLHAQKLDIQHAFDIAVSTDPKDFKDADYCIFTAGYSRSPSVKTRTDLLDKNLPIAKECAEILKGFSGKLIVVTNPMDILTWYFANHTSLDKNQVVGFGGILDSKRFNLALENMGIQETSIVLGEHGENQVPIFSTLLVDVPETIREEVLLGLRGSSMPIIKGKGGTVFGPGYHISQMLENIELGRKMICSLPADGAYGIDRCSIGLPATVTMDGSKIDESLRLDDWEQAKLHAAAHFLQNFCRRI
ncbi:MAG TPA: lactate dehydrogenase [Methanocorpusculum sp.]|nr:lactate dehydrogenase [Methanocorpusculum sp.]